MPQIRKGRWFTRNNRIVDIDACREITDSQTPGAVPSTRTIWSGMMLAADGKTQTSRGDWEADGKYRTPLGVASHFDLVQLISEQTIEESIGAPISTVSITVEELEALNAGLVELDAIRIAVAPYRQLAETLLETVNRILPPIQITETYTELSADPARAE